MQFFSLEYCGFWKEENFGRISELREDGVQKRSPCNIKRHGHLFKLFKRLLNPLTFGYSAPMISLLVSFFAIFRTCSRTAKQSLVYGTLCHVVDPLESFEHR